MKQSANDLSADADLAGFESVPALVTNRFYAQTGNGVARIAFAEKVGATPRYHSAVYMSLDDAQALGVLLLQLAAQARGPVESGTAASEPSEDR